MPEPNPNPNPNPAPNPNPVPPVSNPPANNPEPPAGSKAYTQEQINSMMAAEKRTARQALLKELGFTVEDDKSYTETMKDIKQTLDANKTQAEKDAEARKLAESNLAAAEAKAQQLSLKVSLLSSGVQASYLDDVITIASSKVSETTPIEKVIEELKQKYPMFFTESAPSAPKGTGSGNNPPKKTGNPGDSMGKRLAQLNKNTQKSTYFKNT